MKKITLIIGLFYLSLLSVHAQNYSLEFGKCTSYEITMKSLPSDSLADAVVLYDIGRSFFEKNVDDTDLDLYLERRIKIKILKKSGLSWGEFSIPYYEEMEAVEQVYGIEGNTYNMDNNQITTTPLVPKKKLIEKINSNWYRLKIAMPDVREGSVIELSYKIKSPFKFNFRSWDFQRSIPTLHSELSVGLTPFYEYTYILQGNENLDSSKNFVDPGMGRQFQRFKYSDVVYEYIMKDVPAFRDEKYISSPDDYISRISFQLSKINYPGGTTKVIMTTWKDMADRLIKSDYFGSYLSDAQKKAQPIVDTMSLATLAPMQKLEKIERFVKSNFKWNGDKRKFADLSVKEFLKSGIGNSAEINLFLIAMCRCAGIETDPIILSTRGNGKIYPEYPFLHQFDYVIAFARCENELVSLDATNPLSDFKEIPEFCYNSEVFCVNKDGSKLFALRNPGSSITGFNMDLMPDFQKKSIACKARVNFVGYDALDMRNLHLTDYKSFKDRIVPSGMKQVDSIQSMNIMDYKRPFQVKLEGSFQLEGVDDKFLFSPLCEFTMTENPFKQLTRKCPVDFVTKKERKYNSIVHIPTGYKLFYKPEELSVNTEIGSMIYSVESVDNATLKVCASYKLKKDTYEPAEYAALREFFDKLVSRFNDKLIFVKN